MSIENENPHKNVPWYKLVTHINIALDHRLVRSFLPIKVAEWQLAQSVNSEGKPCKNNEGAPCTREFSGKTAFHDQYKEVS